MQISQAAFDLIIREEVIDESIYRKLYSQPTWPGGRSGVTIAIGYDCGYALAKQIADDWGALLPSAMVEQLVSVAGIYGTPASSHAHELRDYVTVPWERALEVFSKVDVPRWEGSVKTSLKNTEKLSGDSFGALVSLAFNRGCSWSLRGDRYKEMNGIKELMEAQSFAAIPGQIRAMVRLWPNAGGVRQRRLDEANLFEKGLTEKPS